MQSIKKNWTFILIALVSLVLGAIALFTAYKLRTREPVAPTVPQATPEAAVPDCTLSFSLTTEQPGITCTAKVNLEDTSQGTSTVYNDSVGGEISTINAGEYFFYQIQYENTGDTSFSTVTITDPLDGIGQQYLTYVDTFTNACTYDQTSDTVTCNTANLDAGLTKQATFRVQVDPNIPDGTTITNTATLTTNSGEEVTCSSTLTVSNVVPECNSQCSINSDCPSDLICSSGNCRNASCVEESDCLCSTPTPTPTPTAPPTSTPTPTPPVTTQYPQCNTSCTSNADCPSTMICLISTGNTAGVCRNPSCVSETDCTCPVAQVPPVGGPVATPTPAPIPAVPEAGTILPTAGFVIAGAFLVILGLAL